MKRAIVLQTQPTAKKSRELRDFSRKATALANELLSLRATLPKDGKSKLMRLHSASYSASKAKTSFNSQIVCDIERNISKSKGTRVRGITVKLNVPRNCKTFSTTAFNFVELRLYPRKRTAVPIKKNRNWQRYSSLLADGWICKTYGLTPSQQIVAYLHKPDAEPPKHRNVLGIDTNAKHFAVTILAPNGKVLYQTYFGKHIWARRKRLMARRALLQTLGATKKLASLKRRERDFVKTNLGQVVREIILLAKRFDADIAIENLSRFKPKGRNFNRTAMRIPFALFKSILSQRCFDNHISFDMVDSWHTSKWCSHCGAVGKGHSSNYALFKCESCGQTVNADRKASLAVACKSLLERNSHSLDQTGFFQFSNRRVSVNGLLRSDETGLNNAVHSVTPVQESPRL